jgi:hypothetical protein
VVLVASTLLLFVLLVNDNNDRVGGSLVVVNDFFFVSFFEIGLSLMPTWSSPAALYFECWLDTELANTDKERSVVAKGGVLLFVNQFNSKLVQSKE